MHIRTLATLLLHSLLIGLLSSPAIADSTTQTKPTQYWGRIFWSGAAQPKHSFALDLIQEITSRLPEYEHHLQAMSISRGLTDLKQRDDLCMLALAQSAERDRSGYFVGLWPVLPPQLVIRRTDRDAIVGNRSSVSLKELLQDKELRSAIITERLFGPELTPLIEDGIASGQIKKLHTSSHNNNQLNMLIQGRIDFTLDYLESFQSTTENQPELSKKLLLIPITEAKTPRISGIYCSRTARGLAMIERIDAIARDPQVIANFQSIMDKYLPAEPRQAYRQWISDYYQQRPQAAPDYRQ